MHLFGLTEREYINDYNSTSQARAAKAFRDFVEILQAKGRI
jgi:GH35 family endo-1,4-beta-xylanase